MKLFVLEGLILFSLVSLSECYYDGRFGSFRASNHQRTTTRTPTKDLKEIFVGRCHYFGNVMYTDPAEYEPKNCTQLWHEFHNSYNGFEECETPENNYYTFAQSAYSTVKENRSAFWEGLQIFMDEFSLNGRRFTGIANTLTGYVLNNCAWCGKQMQEEDTSDPCTFTWKPNCTEHSFWAAVSRQYAMNAIGRVSLFLNGDRSSVYNKYGLFTTHELPQLYWPKNTHIDVKIVVPLGTLPRESCGTGSLLELKKAIEGNNLTMTCTHYPLDVTHFQCIDNPEAMECRLYYDHDCLMTVESGQERKCAYNSANALFPSKTALLFFVFLFFYKSK